VKLSPLFALANREGPTLIECMIDRDDCTSDLISWGVWWRPPRPPATAAIAARSAHAPDRRA